MKPEIKQRFLNLAISLDQFLFCILTLGYSSPDETFSAACWRWEVEGKPLGFMRKVVDTLFWFDKEHCKSSYLSEFYKKQLPSSYRENS